MRGPELASVVRYVSRMEELSAVGNAIEEHETAARREFIAFVRANAHGVIWPSVVAIRRSDGGGTTIVVRGLAFRFHGGRE